MPSLRTYRSQRNAPQHGLGEISVLGFSGRFVMAGFPSLGSTSNPRIDYRSIYLSVHMW